MRSHTLLYDITLIMLVGFSFLCEKNNLIDIKKKDSNAHDLGIALECYHHQLYIVQSFLVLRRTISN